MPQGSQRIFVTTASPGGRTRVVEGSAAPEASQLRQDRSNNYDADAQFRSAPAFSADERDRLKRARDAALGLAPPEPPQPPAATVRGGRPPPGAAPARTAPSRRAVARGDAKALSPRSKQSANRIAGDTAPSSPRRASKEATSPRAKAASAPPSPPSYDTQAGPASPGSSSGGESYGEESVSPPSEPRPPAFPDHGGTFSLFSVAGFSAVARPAAEYAAVEYPQYIPWGAPALWPRDEPDTAMHSCWQPPAAFELDAASAARAASAAAMAGLASWSAPSLPPVAVRRPSQPSFDVEAARAAARAALAPRGATTPPPNANGELGGSIRRFAASDFLPNGVRSLPGHNGSAWPPDAGGDIDARMRSLRAA